jgi:hypothetical protein
MISGSSSKYGGTVDLAQMVSWIEAYALQPSPTPFCASQTANLSRANFVL